MTHILLNWDHLINTAQEDFIDELKFAFDNLYRYGNESSTYKIAGDLRPIYDNPNYRNCLFIMSLCESHACCQLFRNPYNKIQYKDKFISWRDGLKLVLPKLRTSFRSYLVLERYKDIMIYEAKTTCIGALLLGEKKTQLRNFSWRVCMFIGINTEPWEGAVIASRLSNIRNIWTRYSNQSFYLGTQKDIYDLNIEDFIF